VDVLLFSAVKGFVAAPAKGLLLFADGDGGALNGLFDCDCNCDCDVEPTGFLDMEPGRRPAGGQYGGFSICQITRAYYYSSKHT
jgi:hypothetical protein